MGEKESEWASEVTPLNRLQKINCMLLSTPLKSFFFFFVLLRIYIKMNFNNNVEIVVVYLVNQINFRNYSSIE